MNRCISLITLLVMPACADLEPAEGGSSAASSSCTAQISSVSPTEADTARLDTTVVVEFTTAITTQPIGIYVQGVDGTTALADDGLSASFAPDAPLEPSTTYYVHAEACSHSIDSAFTTEGQVVEEQSELYGLVYAIPFGTGDWQKPAQWDLIVQLLGIPMPDALLLEITDVIDEQTLSLSATPALVSNGIAEPVKCAEVASFGETDFSDNPNLSTASVPTYFPVGIYGGIYFESVAVSFAVGPDLQDLRDVWLEGKVDARYLTLAGDDGPYNACDTDYVDCVPCSDGQAECIEVVVHGQRAPKVDGFDLDEDYSPLDDSDCD